MTTLVETSLLPALASLSRIAVSSYQSPGYILTDVLGSTVAMIDEQGHVDILSELIDGRTG